MVNSAAHANVADELRQFLGNTNTSTSWESVRKVAVTTPWGQDWSEWQATKPGYNEPGHQLGYDPAKHSMGKGFLLQDGSVWTWPIAENLRPQHMEYSMRAKQLQSPVVPGSQFHIRTTSPYRGEVYLDGPGRSLDHSQRNMIRGADLRLDPYRLESEPPKMRYDQFGHANGLLNKLQQKPASVWASLGVKEAMPAYYHLAPTQERDRIQQHGLQAANPYYKEDRWQPTPTKGWGPPTHLKDQPVGVYVGDEEQARGMRTEDHRPLDMWRVDTDDALPNPSPGHDSYNTWYVPHNVDAELHEPYEHTLSTEEPVNPWDLQQDMRRYRTVQELREDPEFSRFNPWGIGRPDRVWGGEYLPDNEHVGRTWTVTSSSYQLEDVHCPHCDTPFYSNGWTGYSTTDGKKVGWHCPQCGADFKEVVNRPVRTAHVWTIIASEPLLPIQMHGCPKCHGPWMATDDDDGTCPHCGYTIPYDGHEIMEGYGTDGPVPGHGASGWGVALDPDDIDRSGFGEPHWGAAISQRGWEVISDYDYRGRHTAPGPDDSEPGMGAFHQIDTVMPDFYEHPEWYTDKYFLPKADQESVNALRAARGNPDASVTIHRAGPYPQINTGDWVTPSHTYARQHLESNGPEARGNTDESPWKVWSARVPASTLWGNGDSVNEYGYHGPSLQGERYYHTQSNPELRPASEINLGAHASAWKFADNYPLDARNFPDPTAPRSDEKPAAKGCTCKEGEKLNCPVHGMNATEPDFDNTWAQPQGQPVGFPQDQPRTWQQAYSSFVAEPSTEWKMTKQVKTRSVVHEPSHAVHPSWDHEHHKNNPPDRGGWSSGQPRTKVTNSNNQPYPMTAEKVNHTSKISEVWDFLTAQKVAQQIVRLARRRG